MGWGGPGGEEGRERGGGLGKRRRRICPKRNQCIYVVCPWCMEHLIRITCSYTYGTLKVWSTPYVLSVPVLGAGYTSYV
jgi:hypothetical protein